MLGIKSYASYLLITISAFTCLFFLSEIEQMPLAYASPSLTAPTTMINTTNSIPNAESVHISESMKVPPSVGTFVILIANEAHENWSDEKHKLITDKNSYYVPTSLVIPNGTAIVFLNADAPWDTPHPHTIEIEVNTGDIVYSTRQLDYTNSSTTATLSPGVYSIMNNDYETKDATITVLANETASGNLILGAFYTSTNQVENIEDNDGVSHPGSLQYFREEFNSNGFDILSEHDFTYATCDYCPGGFWPDNKAGEHTLLIFSTEQPLAEALDKLEEFVRDNVYI